MNSQEVATTFEIPAELPFIQAICISANDSDATGIDISYYPDSW